MRGTRGYDGSEAIAPERLRRGRWSGGWLGVSGSRGCNNSYLLPFHGPTCCCWRLGRKAGSVDDLSGAAFRRKASIMPLRFLFCLWHPGSAAGTISRATSHILKTDVLPRPPPIPLFLLPSHLLWEDRAAHKGSVVAIRRVTEVPPPEPAPPLVQGVKPPPPRRPREWVVSVGSAGEVRVWKVPARWPDDAPTAAAAAAAALRIGDSSRSRGVGLEFCATLLTNSSICSFSCALLRRVAPTAGSGDEEVTRKAFGGGNRERGTDGHDGRAKRRRCRAEAEAGTGGGAAGVERSRLYCAIGSDNGFVQAWELSFDGEKGVGEQPLYSQKA